MTVLFREDAVIRRPMTSYRDRNNSSLVAIADSCRPLGSSLQRSGLHSQSEYRRGRRRSQPRRARHLARVLDTVATVVDVTACTRLLSTQRRTRARVFVIGRKGLVGNHVFTVFGAAMMRDMQIFGSVVDDGTAGPRQLLIASDPWQYRASAFLRADPRSRGKPRHIHKAGPEPVNWCDADESVPTIPIRGDACGLAALPHVLVAFFTPRRGAAPCIRIRYPIGTYSLRQLRTSRIGCLPAPTERSRLIFRVLICIGDIA